MFRALVAVVALVGALVIAPTAPSEAQAPDPAAPGPAAAPAAGVAGRGAPPDDDAGATTAFPLTPLLQVTALVTAWAGLVQLGRLKQRQAAARHRRAETRGRTGGRREETTVVSI